MRLSKTTLVLAIFLLSAVFAAAQDTGSVKGIVRTDTGDKLAGVSIIARLNGKDLKSTVSDRKGEFRLSGLNPGTYNLVFEKDGFSAGVLYDVLIKGRKVNNLKDRLIMTVDEGTLVIVTGSVFNQFGRSVYGAKVTIEEIKDGKPAGKESTLYSSQSGQFTFRFNEGKRTLRVTASVKDVSKSTDVEVDDPAIYRLVLNLDLPEKQK